MIYAHCARTGFAMLAFLALQDVPHAEERGPAVWEVVEDLRSITEVVCKSFYGENEFEEHEPDRWKYYCQRVQHLKEFAQDLPWWKAHMPAILQAHRAPSSPPANAPSRFNLNQYNESLIPRPELSGGLGFIGSSSKIDLHKECDIFIGGCPQPAAPKPK